MNTMPSEPKGEADPLISVLLPVFNGARYLDDAVQSLSSQTYSNFEVIAVDDGSTDDSGRILQETASRDPRFHVIHSENRGLVAALNEGIGAASGAFIARMDQDDICEPSRFRLQSAHLRAHPDCVVVGCNVTEVDGDGEPLKQQPAERTDFLLPDRCQHFQRFPPAPRMIVHPSAMIRTEALRCVGGYRRIFTHGAEDRDLWWRLGSHGDIHALPKRLLRYRVHAGSMSHQRREGVIADTLVGDLSAISRFHRLDDHAILNAYGETRDVGEAIARYEQLLENRYPVWALHAYRVLRRRAWSMLGSSGKMEFRMKAFVRALASISSRPSRYVLLAALR